MEKFTCGFVGLLSIAGLMLNTAKIRAVYLINDDLVPLRV